MTNSELQSTPVADSVETIDHASEPFVGRWHQLVSTTNWEKGRVIQQWREALIEDGVPSAEYSDEAWARRVGGVTGQHVGRLRRVCQRFGVICEEFEGLFWSHFHAALDWEDAEMWLEGAVQNSWSVSKMRHQRWETLGSIEEGRPDERDVVTSELDEDFEPSPEVDPESRLSPDYDDAAGPRHDGPDFGEDESEDHDDSGAAIYTAEGADRAIDFVKPFENMGDLPDDLAEAFENFKLSILRHKSDDWNQISQEDVLGCLDALKELARAPSAEASSF